MVTHYLVPYECERMNLFPLVLYLLSLLVSVLGSLPAPVNLKITSVNFHHVLHWDPGPGTPPGTVYKIRAPLVSSNRSKERDWRSNETSFKLKFKLHAQRETHVLTVQASYNETLSPESEKFFFTPYLDTKITSPKLSLAGCGDCIHINITIPKADKRSGIDDIKNFYGDDFLILWKKRNGKEETPYSTENKSFTLPNLKRGVEYCVRVHMNFHLNPNTEPSAWECAFTSIVEPRRVPGVLGIVAALLFLVLGAVTVFILFLQYTGFICKLKKTMPRGLVASLSQGRILTLEKTAPDRISISPKMEKQRIHNNPSPRQPANGGANSEEEDEDEDEEAGMQIYMDRPTELSSGQSSCKDSGDSSGNRPLAASGDSEVPETEAAHEWLDQHEANAEGEDVSLIPEGGPTAVQGHVTVHVEEEEEEEEEEEMFDSSGNVNLFSVTLAALDAYEEEEEEEEQNTWVLSQTF